MTNYGNTAHRSTTANCKLQHRKLITITTQQFAILYLPQAGELENWWERDGNIGGEHKIGRKQPHCLKVIRLWEKDVCSSIWIQMIQILEFSSSYHSKFKLTGMAFTSLMESIIIKFSPLEILRPTKSKMKLAAVKAWLSSDKTGVRKKMYFE